MRVSYSRYSRLIGLCGIGKKHALERPARHPYEDGFGAVYHGSGKPLLIVPLPMVEET